MSKKFIILLLGLSFNFLYGQVGINTEEPKATLEISKGNIVNLPDGVIIPKLTVSELEEKESLYSGPQNGTLIMITSILPGSKPSTINVTAPGYYYYNQPEGETEGSWKPLGGYSGTEPLAIWTRDENNQLVKLAVNSKGDNRFSTIDLSITDDGNVAIGTNKADDKAILDVRSMNKGISLPNLTNSQLAGLIAEGNIPNGLMVYNTDQNCFNYYDDKLLIFRSICGDYPPAKFNLI